jgi:TLC ATP/ADP transporter
MLSVRACRYCWQEPSIRLLAAMGIAQGLASNTLEYAWKLHLSAFVSDPSQFASFLGAVSTYSGLITLALLPLASLSFSTLGWRTTARATPTLLLLVGGPFFGSCAAYQALHLWGPGTAATQPLLAAIAVCTRVHHRYRVTCSSVGCLGAPCVGIFHSSHRLCNATTPQARMRLEAYDNRLQCAGQVVGSCLYVASRSAKFALFKPAEEMVYKNLDERAQTEGKASVDVVAAQAGKTGGAVAQQVILILSCGSSLVVMAVLLFGFLGVCLTWGRSIDRLAPMMAAKEQERRAAAAAEASAAAAAAKVSCASAVDPDPTSLDSDDSEDPCCKASSDEELSLCAVSAMDSEGSHDTLHTSHASDADAKELEAAPAQDADSQRSGRPSGLRCPAVHPVLA